MKKILLLVATLTSALVVSAAEPAYSCSLKVGNPKNDSKMEKSKNNGNSRNSTQTKTTHQKMIWPVKVSFSGKEIPTEGVTLKCFCLGTTNDKAMILDTKEIKVQLDEKGAFKCDYESPEVTMTKTKRRGNNRNGGGNSSSSSGSRISGCVIQLLVGDTVKRSFATKSTWTKLAAKNPLPEAEILKFR